MKLIAKDYDLMRAWLAHMARIAFPASMLMGKADPVAALDEIAATSPAKASSGLSMAIGDLVALTSEWPDDIVQTTNRALLDAGLPSLSQVRAAFSTSVRRVIRRGNIKDEAEYHAVSNAAEASIGDQEQLRSLLAAYELARGPMS